MFKVAYVSSTLSRRPEKVRASIITEKVPVRIIDKEFKTAAAAKAFITRMGFRSQDMETDLQEYQFTYKRMGFTTEMIASKNRIAWQPVKVTDDGSILCTF